MQLACIPAPLYCEVSAAELRKAASQPLSPAAARSLPERLVAAPLRASVANGIEMMALQGTQSLTLPYQVEQNLQV